MVTNVILPKQGLLMTEGTIIKWLVAEGGDCTEGQPLFEMETDKLTITIDAPATGKLLKIVHQEGDVVPITETIAFIGEAGEKVPEVAAAAATPVAAPAAPVAPVAPSAPAGEPVLAPGVSNVILPKQGLLMTEGTIIKWLVAEGGDCTEGQPLFEMETDKLTITIDAPATGKLLKIVHQEGDVVPITETIAYIGPAGAPVPETVGAAAPAASASVAASAPSAIASVVAAPVARAAGERVFASPRARMRAEEKGVEIAMVGGTGPEGYIVERDVLSFDVKKATPLAKAIAAQNGVNLAGVAGTGAHGKVTKADVLGTMAPAAAPAAVAPVARGTKIIPMTGMRKIIAERMKKSQEINASLTHTVKVDMTNCAQLREKYKAIGKKISYNDIALYAATRALRDFPIMNSELTPEGIVCKEYVNIGMAVALDTGLIVPNIKDADLMRLEEIAAKAAELAGKAKTNKLMPDEYQGGTFTVSNLGMFGIDNFTPIINPPEAGILGIGAIVKTPVVVDDEIVVRPIMMMTLTYDHRVVDGAPAAQFIARIRQYLENPCLML